MKTKRFNPETFIGRGWKLESDTPTPKGLSLSKTTLKSYLKAGESYATGKEILERQGKDVPLNASVLQYLYEHQDEIPEQWKEKTNGVMAFIHFDGTVLVNPDGSRCTLYLCWDGGQWNWRYFWLDFDRSASSPSAVVASSQELDSLPSDPLDLAVRVKKLESILAHYNLTEV